VSRRPGGAEAWIAGLVTLLAFGIRIRGLGDFPLATDEYFFTRAAGFVSEHGVPRFPTGGYYVRGLLSQYLAAGAAALGGGAELAGRLPATLFGALACGATYLLARERAARATALVCALALALSSWNLEFSRFARMYTALQLLLVVHVWAVYRGYFGERRGARAASWSLAAAGPLVHEASLLLPAINALAALARADWPLARTARHVGSAALLFAAQFLLQRVEFRFLSESQALPPTSTAPVVPGLDALHWALGRPATVIGGVLTATLAVGWLVAILRGDSSSGRRASIAALVAAAGLVTGQLVLTFAALTVMAVLCPEAARDSARRARAWIGLLATGVAFWSIVGAARVLGERPEGPAQLLKGWVSRTFLTPPVHEIVAYPFLEAVPVWFGAVSAALAVLTLVGLARELDRLPALVVATCLSAVMLVAAADRPDATTRYLFLLQPFLLLGTALCAAWGFERLQTLGAPGPRRAAIGLSAAGLVLLAAVSGDYHAAHVLDPTADDVVYRRGRFERYAAHWYPRADARTPALHVERNRGPADRVVVAAIPAQAYVRPPFTLYVRPDAPVLPALTVDGGTRSVWTGGPVATSAVAALDPRTLPAGAAVWLVTPREPPLEISDLGPARLEELAAGLGLEVGLAAEGADRRVAAYRIATAAARAVEPVLPEE
jgi:hypothetical protein